MIQVLPKWRVTIWRGATEATVVFHVHDNFLINVQRKVAELDFGVNVTTITLEREPS